MNEPPATNEPGAPVEPAPSRVVEPTPSPVVEPAPSRVVEPTPTPAVEPIATSEPTTQTVQPLTPVGSATPVGPASRGTPPPATSGGGRRIIGYLAAAVIGAVLILGGLAATGSLTQLQPSPSPAPSASPSPAPSPSPAYVGDRVLGDPSAPVAIEMWADYQCPVCAVQAHAIGPSIERTLAVPGQARLAFRDFAFLGQESIDAAVAARCAGRQGAYWYYHDLLFSSQQGENQGAFARSALVGIARYASLDIAAFTACLDDPTVAAAVKTDTEAGKRLGVTATPTIHVVGPGGSELMVGVKPLSEVAAAVERVSKPSPSASPGSSPTATAAAPASPSP